MLLDHPRSTTCPFDDLVSINGFFLEFVMEKLRFVLSNLQPEEGFWALQPGLPLFVDPFTNYCTCFAIHQRWHVGWEGLFPGIPDDSSCSKFPCQGTTWFRSAARQNEGWTSEWADLPGCFFFLEDNNHHFSWWFWWEKDKKKRTKHALRKSEALEYVPVDSDFLQDIKWIR